MGDSNSDIWLRKGDVGTTEEDTFSITAAERALLDEATYVDEE